MKRKNLIIVGVLIAVVLVSSGALPLLGLINELPTNGVGRSWGLGGNEYLRGGSNANGGGDLLDSTAYVTSWTGGGNSEKLVIQGHFYATGTFDHPWGEMPKYWYKVTLTVDNPDVKINGATGTTWTSTQYDTQDFVTGQWYPMQAVTLALTNPASGNVYVELYALVHWYNPAQQSANVLLAEDWGNLRSGIGSVKVQNDVVEEGTDADFYVETAFSHSQIPGASPSDVGWFMQVFSPTGTKVFEKTVADEFSGTISWPVPSGSYSASSTNIYKVVLRNELINQDDDWLFTVGPGQLSQIPNKPTFRITAGTEPFVKGDSITVRISAENTINSMIKGFWVWVSYETSAGTTTDYIYEKSWFPATSTGTGGYADVTFTFPDSGFARLEASTADNLNLNSGMSEMKFTVQGATNEDGGGGGGGDTTTDYTMLIVGLFLLLGAFMLYWKAPIPKPWNIIVAVAMIAVAIYLMYPTLVGG